MSDSLAKAVRYALKKRDRVKRIVTAIAAAAWDANLTGRVHPAKGGMGWDEMSGVAERFEAFAIRELRRKK